MIMDAPLPLQLTATSDFLHSVLDSLSEQVAVIDAKGKILWTNATWRQYAAKDDQPRVVDWHGLHYIEACKLTGIQCHQDLKIIAKGVKHLTANRKSFFQHEYPVSTIVGDKWFLMRISRLNWKVSNCYLVTHLNITQRKRTEQEVHELTLVDGLTEIANRRHFDLFLNNEWRRASRLNTPISLILFDIDCFKSFNDTYGHPAGDECLKLIGRTVQKFGNRPGDLVTRYGGEEFGVILASTDIEHAALIAENIRISIYDLNIPHAHSTVSSRITISAGLAAVVPDSSSHESILVSAADAELYRAKNSGRNRVSLNRISRR